MRVAVVANHDPNDVAKWAGTPFYIVRTLRRHLPNLIVINTPRIDRAMHLLNKLTMRLRIDVFREPIVTRLYAWHLRRKLLVANADLLISIGATHKICDLDWGRPVLHVTDALFGTIVGSYARYAAMRPRSLRLGNVGQCRALARVCRVFLSSGWSAEDATVRYPQHAAKMRHLPFGANVDDPSNPVSETKALRMLFVGGTWDRKGGVEVLQTFEEVCKRVPSCTLDIVGATPDSTTPPGVTVHGHLAKSNPADAARLESLYRQAAFLIVLSRQEAYGIVFCEAAAYGVPAIGTNVGGIPAIIQHERTGLMFAVGEGPAVMAQQIVSLWSDQDRYTAYAKAARRRFETKLNWGVWAKVILAEANQAVLDNGPRSDALERMMAVRTDERMSNYRIQGATGEFEVVIGLEVHAQVTSNAKLFSGASTAFGSEPNTNVSLVDAAMPGMLPVPNRECIRQAVRTGLAIDAKINRWSRFDRKNYFYADLPQGYQISQLYHPLVGEGSLTVTTDEGEKTIGIERIHVEQDAGKLMHDQHPSMSYVDLNRSGVALMEIVSKPDMQSPEEAGAYVRKLRQLLRYVGSCDGNMEQGSMRADVNVSVRRAGEELGTRTETKNVNSVRFIQQVVEFEAKRQVAVIEDGGKIVQETRLFDPDKGVTRSMRSKEDAHDYRYFPDPDLLPLELSEDFVEEARKSLPELPDAKLTRFTNELGISAYNADVLTADVDTANWFEALLAEGVDAKLAANWVAAELFGALNRTGRDINSSPVTPAAAGELLKLQSDGTLSGTLAKQVFEKMLETGDSAGAIVEREGLKQTSDTGAIETAAQGVIDANADKVEQYRGGKEALFGFFVGQTMKAMGGKANPKVVNEVLKKALG